MALETADDARRVISLLRAEYQRLDKVGGSSTGEDNVDFLSLGLEWAF